MSERERQKEEKSKCQEESERGQGQILIQFLRANSMFMETMGQKLFINQSLALYAVWKHKSGGQSLGPLSTSDTSTNCACTYCIYSYRLSRWLMCLFPKAHSCASSGGTNAILAIACRSKKISSGSSKMPVAHVAPSSGERKINGSRQG